MIIAFQQKLLIIISKKILLGSLFILLFNIGWASFAQNISVNSGSARFLVISDFGGCASDNQKVVAAAMGKEAKKIRAQFVVTIGDNYHGERISSENDPRWKTEFEDIYSALSLQIPWYASLGNHDYRGNPEGEIAYSKLSNRWNLPSRYYIQKEPITDKDSILIVHLDTTPFLEEYHQKESEYAEHVQGQDTGKQLKWLDSVLTVSKACWTMVVGHHPIFSSAPKHGDTKELVELVLPILKKHGVRIYASGHDHVLQHLKEGDMHFFICGGGANFRDVAERDDVLFGIGALGFLSITATKNELAVNYIGVDNKIINSSVITK